MLQKYKGSFILFWRKIVGIAYKYYRETLKVLKFTDISVYFGLLTILQIILKFFGNFRIWIFVYISVLNVQESANYPNHISCFGEASRFFLCFSILVVYSLTYIQNKLPPINVYIHSLIGSASKTRIFAKTNES